MKQNLLDGESPLQDAPSLQIDHETHCIPQHFLQYRHSKETIEQLILDCDFDEHFLIFVGDDGRGLYIQVGIVGFDTYKSRQQQPRRKLVYGRKWYIETDYPTSELLQTIFLAIKKAREHELRELLKLRVNQRWSAPFSTHQDFPLIAKMSNKLANEQHQLTLVAFENALAELEHNLRFDYSRVQFEHIEQRSNGQYWVDIKLINTPQTLLPESKQAQFTLMLSELSVNHLLFHLIEALIQRSDHYVAEHFSYKGICRFSHTLSIQKIAELSVNTRAQALFHSDTVTQAVDQQNQAIDHARAPTISSPLLAAKVEHHLQAYGPLEGFYPKINTTQDNHAA